MKKFALIATLCLVFCVPRFASAAADSPAGSSDSTDKALVIQVEVPAPLDDVWNAFATSDGLSTWLFPNATVDLRPGGDWLVHFPGGSTGGGTIVSFVPKKELIIAALCPDRFPHVRAERTHAAFTFEAHGNSTIVRLTQTGWKTGSEWDQAYEYLTAGNAQLMSTLVHRFVNGPTDWKKAFAAAGDHN